MQNMDFFHCANIMKSIGLPFVSSTKESNFMLVTHSYFTETYFPHAFLIFWEFCLRKVLDVRKPIPDISDNPCDKEANILHHLHLFRRSPHNSLDSEDSGSGSGKSLKLLEDSDGICLARASDDCRTFWLSKCKLKSMTFNNTPVTWPRSRDGRVIDMHQQIEAPHCCC